jgi:Mn2+/Fe2+ NRAMP family transporter
VSRSFRQAPLFVGLFTGQIAIGSAIALAPGNLVDLLLNMQVLNGVITPIVLTFILVLANRPSVLGDAANTRVFRAVATACVIAIAIMAVLVVAQTLTGG